VLEQDVYRLLHLLNIDYSHQLDLELIACACKVEIRSTRLRSHALPHPTRKGWKIIFIEEGLPIEEWRRKTAHELGHCLQHFASQFEVSAPYMTRQENQADRFAECLLVPFFMFRVTDMPDIRYYEQGVRWIAEEFKVPLGMAERRWNEWNRQNSEKKLSVAESPLPYTI
jgi:Zn-dependent peptidase ImmA (M78 family)